MSRVFVLCLVSALAWRAEAVPANARILTLLGIEKAQVVATGVLTLVDGGGVDHHELYLIDHAVMSFVAIEDSDNVGARQAIIRPFLGQKDLIEVVLTTIGDAHYRRERHLILRSAGTLQLVCEIEGSYSSPPDPPTVVTIARGPIAPGSFAFDVDTRIGKDPVKRTRNAIEKDGVCGGGLEAPIVAAPLEGAIVTGVTAAHYVAPQIIKRVDGQYFLVDAAHVADGPHALLLVSRARPNAPILLSEEAPFHAMSDGLTAGFAPFLGQRDLRDLQVTASHSNGMGGNSGTRHYLLRGNELVCDFDGPSSSGMEDVNTSTSVTIDKVGDKPLRFALRAQTSSNARMHRNDGGDASSTECTVPPRGHCTCEPSPTIGGRQ